MDEQVKPAVYVVATGSFGGGDIAGSLLTADGEVLYSHVSSSMGWLRADLTTGFGERRLELEERFPDGYEVEAFGPGDEVPEWLIKANQEWAASTREAAQS